MDMPIIVFSTWPLKRRVLDARSKTVRLECRQFEELPVTDFTGICPNYSAAEKFLSTFHQNNGRSRLFLSFENEDVSLWYCSDITWAPWRLNSPAFWLFVQQLVQSNDKKIPKGHITSGFPTNGPVNSKAESQGASDS